MPTQLGNLLGFFDQYRHYYRLFFGVATMLHLYPAIHTWFAVAVKGVLSIS